jgi:hypothetical protein
MITHIVPSQTARRRLIVAADAAILVGIGFGAGCVAAAQPHMFNALHALQNARVELEVASHDKAGHRAAELRLVDEAIEEVRAGIAVGG